MEDLVECCIEAKLFTMADNNGVNYQQSGSLAMAAQPWTSTDISTAEDLASTAEDLTSTAEDLTSTDSPQLPLGMETLRTGIAELNTLGSNRDITSFDPSNNIQTAWNPAEFDTRYDDGGVWDSFNLSDEMITGILTGQDVDFASFVNAEHIA